MVLTSPFGALMEDQILQYYQIVLSINDRAFIYIYIYVCVCVCVCEIELLYNNK